MKRQTPPKVGILLSTYNGEPFLHELLESIAFQDYPNIALFIRDDGSTDNTQMILSEYAKRDNVTVIYGSNLGVVGSFFYLLRYVVPQVDFVAFCDQDDIWRPDKISRAVTRLQKYVFWDQPGLYFSNYDLVDEKLNKLGQGPVIKKPPTFNNAVVQNVVTGCTAVLNRNAARLIGDCSPDLYKVIMHDWWAYLVVAATGRVIYDPEPTLLYRRHGINLMGAYDQGFVKFWMRRIKRLLRFGYLNRLRQQVAEFEKCFGANLPQEKKRVIAHFLGAQDSLKARINYSANGEAYYQTTVDTLIFNCFILFSQLWNK